MFSELIRKKFISLFNTNPLIVRSPGCVNLIGDFSGDYIGNVLSLAIDKDVICAISPNYSDNCQVHAYNFKDSESFDIRKYKKTGKNWLDNILGVVAQFQKANLELEGFDCVFGSDIPVGAGICTSAALESAFAYSFNLLFEHNLTKTEIVKISQAAEGPAAGLKCKVTEHFTSVFGKTNYLLRVDGSTLDYEYLAFPMHEYRLVLCHPDLPLTVVTSNDAVRRLAYEKGLAILKKHNKSMHSLHDIAPEQLAAHRSEFDPAVYKQCEFVVDENARLIECCEMMKRQDIDGFGRNMFNSHNGLNEVCEVSCRELDFLTKQAQSSGLATGSRMIGGASGSGSINIVKLENVDAFIKFISESYTTEFGLPLKTTMVKIENGTGKL